MNKDLITILNVADRPKQNDLFRKMKFKEDQLEAIRTIYNKYFASIVPTEYNGSSVACSWKSGFTYKMGEGDDIFHAIAGVNVKEANKDPLWNNHFSDILDIMNLDGNVSIIPPGGIMLPHVDRAWRPCAIYFPIEGCSEECVSEFYHLPPRTSENSQTFPDTDIEPIYSYAVNTHAYLQNVHQWHGVKNKSNRTRIAFGWNTVGEPQLPYNKLVKIFTQLGYIE